MRLMAVSVLGVLFVACASGVEHGVLDGHVSEPPTDDAGTGPCGPRDCDPRPATAHCGDGILTKDEACDDKNRLRGDGCAANCLSVEPGYSCNPPGQPCHVIARCGDGHVALSELCDDGNELEGDGCSARCKLEIGFACEGTPSSCRPTTCGDDLQEGSEACDDGNQLPFDGCSARCQVEPDCSGGACASTCGDGLVLNEACDDGNDRNGDGCSAACEVEPGFTCTANEDCELRDGQCILRAAAIYRDFNADHPDFAVGCGSLTTGIVEDQLSADGKPVLRNGSNACIESSESFREWYTSSARNATIPGELILYENASGGFVNRYGPAGEQWGGQPQFTNVQYGGAGGGGCTDCMPSATGQCFDPCIPWGTGNTQACCGERTQTMFDGNPLFFPIDGDARALPDERLRAKVPEQYGYVGWPWEDAVLPGASTHNFHFTTEVVYWFKYDANSAALLEFSGDDDVWVFVNCRLAVDLGGPHVPTAGQLSIDASSAPTFELVAGNVYPIRVFHAERKAEGSSFKLTLAGFNTARSDCSPTCGDGIVALGEQCDDGINDGGYGECNAGCVLGPYCGDGIVQEEEDCDDGNFFDDDACGSACREIILL